MIKKLMHTDTKKIFKMYRGPCNKMLHTTMKNIHLLPFVFFILSIFHCRRAVGMRARGIELINRQWRLMTELLRVGGCRSSGSNWGITTTTSGSTTATSTSAATTTSARARARLFDNQNELATVFINLFSLNFVVVALCHSISGLLLSLEHKVSKGSSPLALLAQLDALDLSIVLEEFDQVIFIETGRETFDVHAHRSVVNRCRSGS